MKTTRKAQETEKWILEYIDRYYKKHGYMPSYREIMVACHFKSTSSVCIYMDRLFQKGYLQTEHPGNARAFRRIREGGNDQANA